MFVVFDRSQIDIVCTLDSTQGAKPFLHRHDILITLQCNAHAAVIRFRPAKIISASRIPALAERHNSSLCCASSNASDCVSSTTPAMTPLTNVMMTMRISRAGVHRGGSECALRSIGCLRLLAAWRAFLRRTCAQRGHI